MQQKFKSLSTALCISLAAHFLCIPALQATDKPPDQSKQTTKTFHKFRDLPIEIQYTVVRKMDIPTLCNLMCASNEVNRCISTKSALYAIGFSNNVQRRFYEAGLENIYLYRHGQGEQANNEMRNYLTIALQSFTIAARCGHQGAMEAVGKLYADPDLQLPLLLPALPPALQRLINIYFTRQEISCGRTDEEHNNVKKIFELLDNSQSVEIAQIAPLLLCIDFNFNPEMELVKIFCDNAIALGETRVNSSKLYEAFQTLDYRQKLQSLVASGNASQDQEQTYAVFLIRTKDPEKVLEGMTILERLFHKTWDPKIVKYYLLSHDLISSLQQQKDHSRLTRLRDYAVKAIILGNIETISYSASNLLHGVAAFRILQQHTPKTLTMMALYLYHRCLTLASSTHQEGVALHGEAAKSFSRLIALYKHGERDPQTSALLFNPNYQQVGRLLALAYKFNHLPLLVELGRYLEGKPTSFSAIANIDPTWLQDIDITPQMCWEKMAALEEQLIHNPESACYGYFIKCMRSFHGDGMPQDTAKAYAWFQAAHKYKGMDAGHFTHFGSAYLDYSCPLAIDILHAEFLKIGVPGIVQINLDGAADLLYMVFCHENRKRLLDDYYGGRSLNEGRFRRMKQLAQLGSVKAQQYLEEIDHEPDQM